MSFVVSAVQSHLWLLTSKRHFLFAESFSKNLVIERKNGGDLLIEQDGYTRFITSSSISNKRANDTFRVTEIGRKIFDWLIVKCALIDWICFVLWLAMDSPCLFFCYQILWFFYPQTSTDHNNPFFTRKLVLFVPLAWKLLLFESVIASARALGCFVLTLSIIILYKTNNAKCVLMTTPKGFIMKQYKYVLYLLMFLESSNCFILPIWYCRVRVLEMPMEEFPWFTSYPENTL